MYQLEFTCRREEADPLSVLLEEFGAVSIVFTDKNDDPIFEPEIGTTPLWPEVVTQALYADAVEAQLAKAALEKLHPALCISLECIEEQDWQRVCMQDFQAQCFGKRLWVCPSWQSPPDPQAVNLLLDPGLAFGTGTHPTTALCLSFLDEADLAGKSVIDYGCGSGILAIAAAKLGGNPVHAVDIDPQALSATHNNALNNAVLQEGFSIAYPSALNEQCDFLIANILLTPLMELEQRFHQLIKTHGRLIISGILNTQVETLLSHYHLFKHEKTEFKEDWALMVFEAL